MLVVDDHILGLLLMVVLLAMVDDGHAAVLQNVLLRCELVLVVRAVIEVVTAVHAAAICIIIVVV